MGVKLNICLLVLLLATISSQGYKLRVKDDSKDEKPFGIDRRQTPGSCQFFGGQCTSNKALCPPPFHVFDFAHGCAPGTVCCCPGYK
ncbi:small cysteine-rich protein 3-like isoform X1 [Acropora millepora]|uniref:small cysteine-rich protein 3-like isoform X1 n=1 Tax=Acropora millepora TaxID=45264 RepID=UPI001CF574F9|nr:small cysteine-rich protein 3-like isoform X1 [Acropora millepora]